MTLLEHLEKLTGLHLPVEALREAAEANRTEIDEQIAASPENTAVVTALEQQFDSFQAAREGSNLLGAAGEVPSAEELGAEFERFLADQDRTLPAGLTTPDDNGPATMPVAGPLLSNGPQAPAPTRLFGTQCVMVEPGDVARAVLAEVGRTLQLVLGEGLRLQRRQVADVVGGDAEAVADALAELVLDHEEVPDHPLLDVAVALREGVDEVGDQVVLLPLLRQQVALAGLLVVVGPRDPLAGEPAGDLRALLVVRRVRAPRAGRR